RHRHGREVFSDCAQNPRWFENAVAFPRQPEGGIGLQRTEQAPVVNQVHALVFEGDALAKIVVPNAVPLRMEIDVRELDSRILDLDLCGVGVLAAAQVQEASPNGRGFDMPGGNDRAGRSNHDILPPGSLRAASALLGPTVPHEPEEKFIYRSS